MEPLLIYETEVTPKIEFYPDGNLFIEGRSLPIDSIGFYNPIIKWVNEISAPVINLLIRMEYMNTSSAKQLYTIMILLKENVQVKSLNINWYYEEDDNDGHDTGLEFETLIDTPFRFYAYSEEVF